MKKAKGVIYRTKDGWDKSYFVYRLVSLTLIIICLSIILICSTRIWNVIDRRRTNGVPMDNSPHDMPLHRFKDHWRIERKKVAHRSMFLPCLQIIEDFKFRPCKLIKIGRNNPTPALGKSKHC